MLDRFETSRLLDDRRYAQNLVSSLRGRGSSARKVEQKLRARGVEGDLLREVARPEGPGVSQDEELTAARTFVRRKRLLERYLADPRDRASREKALAALARQGFSFDTARRALELEARDADV